MVGSNTGLEIKETGHIVTDHGIIAIADIGEPDPVDYQTFDILRNAKVVDPSNSMITVEKDGEKNSFFIGERSDALYLSKEPTGKRVYGALISDNFKEQEEPFSDLTGSTVSQLIMNYLSASDKKKLLPYEVIIIGSNGKGYQVTSDSDGEIIVFKDTKENILRSKFNAVIGRGNSRIKGY
ncbi:Uncharacterised protein [uncultured archaeon]|nr:Uncharacterised protein [uncultured archaeon]